MQGKESRTSGRGKGTENKSRTPLVKGCKTRWVELGIRYALFISAMLAVVIVFFIIVFLFREAYPAFTGIGTGEIIAGDKWNPTGEPPAYGARPLIAGTLLVTLGAMVFSVPIGIGSAIFIAELAPPRIRQVLKSFSEILSGIPSVVYGFFGLVVLTDFLRVSSGQPTGESWLAGSLILGIMALPMIVSVSEDAISSVPREYVEASLATGATRWQTVSRVVLPAAMSGIAAAIILGMGRAIGETMAVMMVCGNSPLIPQPITNVFSPIRTITSTLGIEMGEVAWGGDHYSALFALAVILFIITIVMNSIANYILNRLKNRFRPSARTDAHGTAFWLTRPPPLALTIERVRKRLAPRLPALRMWADWALKALAALVLVWLLVSWFGWLYGPGLIALLVLMAFLWRRASERLKQLAAFGMLTAAVLTLLFLLGIILYYIIVNGAPALSVEFLTSTPRDIGRAGGILPAIVGTLYLVAGALLLAVPVGIGAGIYLNEYAREGKLTKFIRAGIDNLNGTPSIVFGLFGLSFLVLYLKLGVSMLAGQLTLGFMILPTIIRTTEEALKTVPQPIREASLATGATKWQTIRKVVLPNSAPGILTGIVLAMGRAAGETAPIMFTAVVFSTRFLPESVLDPVMALPYHLFALATSVPGAKTNAYGTALVLLLVVLPMYAAATILRLRYVKNVRW
ncbi:MAG: phosphate ABC transporter permease PstA [Thermoplasmata archaeon]